MPSQRVCETLANQLKSCLDSGAFDFVATRSAHIVLQVRQVIKPFVHTAVLLILVTCTLAACTSAEKGESNSKYVEQELDPVLEVKKDGYTFSMYPDYLSPEESILKLGVRDANDRFVRGASVDANLIATDGHRVKVEFREDNNIERYVAAINLKHHENYEVDAHIDLGAPGAPISNPRFRFHCGDPVP